MEIKNRYYFKALHRKYYNRHFNGRWKKLPVKQVFSESTTIGVDIGIKDFAVMSTENRLKILILEKLYVET